MRFAQTEAIQASKGREEEERQEEEEKEERRKGRRACVRITPIRPTGIKICVRYWDVQVFLLIK